MASDQTQAYHKHKKRTGMVLTEEEKKIISECYTEAFWYRSVPLFLTSALGIRFLAFRGILKRRSGPVAVARDIGLFFASSMAGNILYNSACRAKVLQRLPNSSLAEGLRRGKSGTELIAFMNSSESNEPDSYNPSINTGFDSRQADYHRHDKDDYSGNVMDDTTESFRPSMDNEMQTLQPDSTGDSIPKYNSYEELRRQNRLDYERQRRTAPPQPAPQQEQSSQPQSPRPSSHYEPQASHPRYKTNKYGDVIED